jgi:protein-disulfide isomerase
MFLNRFLLGYQMAGEEMKEKGAGITEKLRGNPWILSTFVLAVLVAVLLAGSLGSISFTGNAISADDAGNILKSLYESGGVTGLSVDSVREVSGVYEVDFLYQGNTVPVYITKDGKYAGSLDLVNGTSSASTGTGNVAPADVSAFTEDPALYPSLGPDNAQNVVIEFSDFQCPFCALASGLPSWVSQYQSQYSDLIGAAQKIENLAKQGKVKFIYVSMSFLGQESVYAAEAGLCANEQGKFWEMHDALFTAQTEGENTGKFNKDKLEIIASGISGLNQAQFKTCLEGDKYLSDVQIISSEAGSIASGTPTFYVNGQQVSASWTALQSALGM